MAHVKIVHNSEIDGLSPRNVESTCFLTSGDDFQQFTKDVDDSDMSIEAVDSVAVDISRVESEKRR